MPLQGRLALVTGASRGLGRMLALGLAAQRARVLCLGRDTPALAEVATTIVAAGGEAGSIVCDLAQSETIEPTLRDLGERYGWPEIVINNAGIAPSGPIARLDLAQWQATFALNCTAPALIAKVLLPHLQERTYGRMVNIASVAGLRGSAYLAAYAASKHALIGLTRVLAAETKTSGVTVNAVCPGFLVSEITQRAAQAQAQRRSIAPEQALRDILATTGQTRLIELQEVVQVVLTLCATSAQGIHGQALEVLP